MDQCYIGCEPCEEVSLSQVSGGVLLQRRSVSEGTVVTPRLAQKEPSFPGCVNFCLHSTSVLMRSDAPLLFPCTLPRGRRSSCGAGVFLCVPPVPLPACSSPTSYRFNTRFTPTSPILLATHNLNTFFFSVQCITPGAAFIDMKFHYFCVSTAVLEHSGLFPHLLSTLPPALHTHFFKKLRYFKAYPSWIISLAIFQSILTEKACRKHNHSYFTTLHK